MRLAPGGPACAHPAGRTGGVSRGPDTAGVDRTVCPGLMDGDPAIAFDCAGPYACQGRRRQREGSAGATRGRDMSGRSSRGHVEQKDVPRTCRLPDQRLGGNGGLHSDSDGQMSRQGDASRHAIDTASHQSPNSGHNNRHRPRKQPAECELSQAGQRQRAEPAPGSPVRSRPLCHPI